MMGRRALVGVLLAGVLTVLAAPSAAPHSGGSTGYAAITVDGARIDYTLTLWPATLPAEIGAELRPLRAGDPGRDARLPAVLRDKLTMTAQGQRCEAGTGSISPAGAEADRITLVLDFACPEPVRDLGIRDDLFDVLGADYHTLARIHGPSHVSQFAFTPETREARLRLGRGGVGLRAAGSFFWLGIEHILSGWDHLLFVLALLLPGGGLLALVKIITAFTLAHSVTLALAALNVVRLPERLIEAVIAISIAAVAVENLRRRPAIPRRWVVSFAFGLVHGFGFSSALREVGLPTDGLLVPLVGFNAGVEVGQLLVVALTLPALQALRRTSWERPMIRGSSMAILLIGLVLFVERAFL